jgi:hypothetical protein
MHYAPDDTDVVDVVVHQNSRLSEVVVIDILEAGYLSAIFSILDPAKIKEVSDPVEKLTDWELFQTPPLNRFQNIKIHFSNEYVKQHVTFHLL